MIYLDNAATSFPKPEGVYTALDRFARTALANPGRAGHKMARGAKDALDDGRNRLAKFFNAAGPDRVAFALNCTDALNMAIKGVVHPGDHVVTTDLEHNSVSRPLTALEAAGVITLTRVHADAGGTVDPAAVAAAFRPNTRLVVVTHASNVLGTIQPVAEIGALCKNRGVLFLVDAAQTAGVAAIDVRGMNIDLLAFPGHKGLFGPTGTGGLVVAPGVPIRAWREGGTGGDSTSPTQPEEFPFFLEGGTSNVLGVVGMAAGLHYVEAEGIDKLRQHEVELCDRFRGLLAGRPEFQFLGHHDATRKVGTLSFRCDVLDSETIAGHLDANCGIAVRAGLHCSPHAHRSAGSYPDGLVRVSPGPFNTADDIDRLAAAVAELTGF